MRDNVIEEELREEKTKSTQTLEGFYKAFKDYLISSLTLKDFSNLFAQTITYGLFAARSRAEDGFNRKLAYDYIPHTIGILRDVFRFISSADLPQSMEWIVDDIAEVLDATDVKKIIGDFYKEGKGKDPIIHFYETFLAEYDPKERGKRGVYYTPEPVVSYIVRSVHKLLKEKFGKEDGFATSSVTVLDPAAGTLTFPAFAIHEAVKEYKNKYGEGGVANLIRDHILKNFYAFELMMAPYAVGHLKIGFVLEELGYKLSENERFKLYLTNTLESKDLAQSEMPGLISLSKESELAGKVKREVPILVIIGNPPYSVSSDNKSEFIEKIMGSYKEDVRSERNIQPLSDDYIKFIRFAHWKIEQAGKGIIGMITNNSYLSGLIHRGMRNKLAECFDKIYILNLHGNSLIGETAPDGSKDENVFDIRQGVTIALFVKTGEKKKGLAKVFYEDLYGLRGDIDKRGTKYYYLWNNDVSSTKWKKVSLISPQYFFAPKDHSGIEKYNQFHKIENIFEKRIIGVATGKDNVLVDIQKNSLKRRLSVVDKNLFTLSMQNSSVKKNLLENWREQFEKINLDEEIKPYAYRPFDVRFTIYNKKILQRSRYSVMRSMLFNNIGLICMKAIKKNRFTYFYVTDSVTDRHILDLSADSAYVFPLYLYEEKEADLNPKKQQSLIPSDQPTLKAGGKRTNIKQEFIELLKKNYDAKPEEVLYYIYAILYSNIYREKYQEFLKIDFPRIPFTKDRKLFLQLADLGKQLVGLHLLKSPELDKPIAKFYGKGDARVETREFYDMEIATYWPEGGEKPEFKSRGIVKINDSQFFGGVPKEVWNYYIGGYQVLDKWLKDRKGRVLSSEDIKHYCWVVTAIAKTIEKQKEIDRLYPKVEKNLIKF